MHKAIATKSEGRRGCGWRKTGGLYLVDDGEGVECGRLPIPCQVCPCCGRGFRPARGFTWVDGDEILRAAPVCPFRGKPECETCAVHNFARHGVGRVGLIWIGEKFYPTVNDYIREVEVMGDSRRIAAIPNDYKIGETVIFLAHRKAILKSGKEMGEEIEWIPGIFRIIKPSRVEVIVDGSESDEEIDGYVKRGLTPVLVERVEDKQEEMGLAL